MPDNTAAHLANLEPNTRLAAYWLVYATRTAGFPVVITSSIRTASEQAALVAAGRSKTLNSKHLQGKAFDIDIYGMNRNDVPRWFWDELGPWAEQNLGLVWGGRWKSPYDPGHFEAPT